MSIQKTNLSEKLKPLSFKQQVNATSGTREDGEPSATAKNKSTNIKVEKLERITGKTIQKFPIAIKLYPIKKFSL